jgi:hypothetical protein
MLDVLSPGFEQEFNSMPDVFMECWFDGLFSETNIIALVFYLLLGFPCQR